MPYQSKAQQGYLHSQKPDVAAHFDAATPKSSYAKLPRKVHHRGRPGARYGGTSVTGRRSEDVEKGLGDWKTIDQREQHQRRDRKIRRGALAVSGAGAGLAGASIRHRNLQGGNAVEDAHNIMHPVRGHSVYRGGVGRSLSHMTPMARAAALPHGAGVLGGAGLIGAGLATAAGATGMKGHHQRKINQRRRANHGRGSKQVRKAFTPTTVLARTKPIAQLAADGGANLSPAGNAAQAVNAPKTQGSAGAAGKTNTLAGKLTGMAASKPMTGMNGAGGKLASMGAQQSQKPVAAMGSIGTIGSMSKADRPMLVRTQRRSHDPERGRQFRLGAATAGTAAGGGLMLARGGRELRELNRAHPTGMARTALVNVKGGSKAGVGIAGLVGASQLARYAAGNKNRRWT